MDFPVTPIERAFQLAKSGQVSSVTEIRKRLKAEGFPLAQITGRGLEKQLRELISTAQS